jgi:hypothetical protein
MDILGKEAYLAKHPWHYADAADVSNDTTHYSYCSVHGLGSALSGAQRFVS